MKPPFFFNIDVLGACNLRCPSCPQGNSDGHLPKTLMAPAKLRAILAKATQECTVEGVGLFNWTEPTLHPKLAELVTIVETEYRLPCYLSTNLNRPIRQDVLDARPHSIRISCSGFTQEKYGRTHSGGRIEEVKRNMRLLSQNKDYRTQVHVLWHRYNDNQDDEGQMRLYARSLGFKFETCEAHLMPLEMTLGRWAGTVPQQIVESLLITPLETAKKQCEARKDLPCRLQNHEITLDSEGKVQLCCAVFNPSIYSLGDYLLTPLWMIQTMKQESSHCTDCMAKGGHVYAMQLGKGESVSQKLSRLYHSKLSGFVPARVALAIKRLIA